MDSYIFSLSSLFLILRVRERERAYCKPGTPTAWNTSTTFPLPTKADTRSRIENVVRVFHWKNLPPGVLSLPTRAGVAPRWFFC